MIPAIRVCDFIWEHRGDKVFREFSYTDVVSLVMTAMPENNIAIVTTPDESEILGVAIGYVEDTAAKIYHVSHTLTIYPGVIKELVKLFQAVYPAYSITATRRGKPVIYGKRTPALLQKLVHCN